MTQSGYGYSRTLEWPPSGVANDQCIGMLVRGVELIVLFIILVKPGITTFGRLILEEYYNH